MGSESRLELRRESKGDHPGRCGFPKLDWGREGQCRDCAVVWVISHRVGLCDCTRGLVRRRSRLSLLNKFPVPLPSLVPGPHTETRVPSMSTERSGWRKLVQQRAAADGSKPYESWGEGSYLSLCPQACRVTVPAGHLAFHFSWSLGFRSCPNQSATLSS